MGRYNAHWISARNKHPEIKNEFVERAIKAYNYDYGCPKCGYKDMNNHIKFHIMKTENLKIPFMKVCKVCPNEDDIHLYPPTVEKAENRGHYESHMENFWIYNAATHIKSETVNMKYGSYVSFPIAQKGGNEGIEYNKNKHKWLVEKYEGKLKYDVGKIMEVIYSYGNCLIKVDISGLKYEENTNNIPDFDLRINYFE